MARQYEALRDGRITGPHRSHELKAMIAADQLSGQDKIRVVGEGTWFRIDTIEALRPHLAPISPPIPPPPIPPPPPIGWSSVRDLQQREVMSPVAEQSYCSTPPYPGVELRSETDKQPRSDLSRSVTSVVAAGFGLLGVADFALFNFGIWDFYSGFNISGSFIEPFTPIAAGVVSGLMFSMASKTPDSAAGVRWAVSLVGALTISLVIITSYSASAIGIEWRVRGGSLAMCPHHSLNEMAEAFLADPRWDTFEVLQGSHAVNLSGSVSIDGRPAEVLLQFMVYGDAFELYAVEIDGEQMPHLVGYEVLEAACEAAD